MIIGKVRQSAATALAFAGNFGKVRGMTDANPDDGRRAAGRAVRVQRGELGLTQAEVASRAGVDVDTLSDMENGKRWPWPKNVAAIARVLGLDAAELQRIADEPVQAAS